MKVLPSLLGVVTAADLYGSSLDLGPNGITYDRELVLDASTFNTSFNLEFNSPVHLFRGTLNFLVGIDVQLDREAGFLTGSGYLLDAYGQPLGPTYVLGSARSGNVTWVSLFPQIGQPFDFYGVHFDLNVPAGNITGLGFELRSLDVLDQPGFRIGPHVADNGPAWLLLTIALLPLARKYLKQ